MHGELLEKYKCLEITYDAINLETSLPPSSSSSDSIAYPMHEELTCSCETCTLEHSILKDYHKLKEEREMVMDGFERLTRGRTLHKEILGRSLVNNSSYHGLGSYPAVIDTLGKKDDIPSWVKPLLADDYFCDLCYKDGHTNKDCPMVRSSKIMPNSNLFHENTHFKLFRNKNGKVMARPLGPPDKKRKVKKIWVPKCIVDLERDTKLKWVPKKVT